MLSMSPLRVMGPLASTVGDMGTWGHGDALRHANKHFLRLRVQKGKPHCDWPDCSHPMEKRSRGPAACSRSGTARLTGAGSVSRAPDGPPFA
jgi:hypothetical protein